MEYTSRWVLAVLSGLNLQAQAPQISPVALLGGVGMIAVAVGFIVYAAVRRLGWGYLALGALAWAAAVALKFLFAFLFNSVIYHTLQDALPKFPAEAVFSVYVGVLTGLSEVLLVWLALRYTRLGKVSWSRALAFGIGFGVFEALLLGISSLASVLVAMTRPDSLPPATLEAFAQQSGLAWSLAPIVERFFTILIHMFANGLIFYAAAKREARWMWLAFLYKTVLDMVAGYVQLIDQISLTMIWNVEAFITVLGILGWIGLGWLRPRYPETESKPPEELAAQSGA